MSSKPSLFKSTTFSAWPKYSPTWNVQVTECSERKNQQATNLCEIKWKISWRVEKRNTQQKTMFIATKNYSLGFYPKAKLFYGAVCNSRRKMASSWFFRDARNCSYDHGVNDSQTSVVKNHDNYEHNRERWIYTAIKSSKFIPNSQNIINT